MNGFGIVGNRNFFVRISRFYFVNSLCNVGERTGQHIGKHHGNRQNNQKNNSFQDQRLPVQHIHGRHNIVRGNTGQHNAPDHDFLFFAHVGCIRYRLRNGRRHFYVAVFPVIIGNALVVKRADNLLGNNGFTLADAVGILHHLEVPADDNNTTVVKVRKHVQLRTDHFGRIILQIIVVYQVVG